MLVVGIAGLSEQIVDRGIRDACPRPVDLRTSHPVPGHPEVVAALADVSVLIVKHYER